MVSLLAAAVYCRHRIVDDYGTFGIARAQCTKRPLNISRAAKLKRLLRQNNSCLPITRRRHLVVHFVAAASATWARLLQLGAAVARAARWTLHFCMWTPV